MTPDGYTVQPSIHIPRDALDVIINAVDEVLAKIAGQVTPQNVGQLELGIFFNEAGLEAIGDNLFRETPSSGPANVGSPGAVGFSAIQQGFLETSNVNAVQEITALITAQRAYEMNSRVISAADEMLAAVTNLR